MKFKSRLGFSFAWMILLSCDTSTVIDLPKNPPRLTLNCVGQNGEPWKARITVSTGILEFPDFKFVKNATVSVFENDLLKENLAYGNFIDRRELGQPIECNYGSINFSPLPGNTYRIEVVAPPYQTITSTYLQPMPVEVDTLVITELGPSPSQLTGITSTDFRFNVTFVDPPGENFYQLEILRAKTIPDINYGQIAIDFIDPAYRESNEMFPKIYSPRTFADTYFNNKKVSLDFNSTIYQDVNTFNYYVVVLRNITKEYYLYLKTINQHDINLGDPFAQPVFVETNVTNGFGIFCGYSQTVKAFKLN